MQWANDLNLIGDLYEDKAIQFMSGHSKTSHRMARRPQNRCHTDRLRQKDYVLIALQHLVSQLRMHRDFNFSDGAAPRLLIRMLVFTLMTVGSTVTALHLTMQGSPQSLSNTRLRSTTRSEAVILAYINQRWHLHEPSTTGRGKKGIWPTIPDSFYLKGKKRSVDLSLRPIVTGRSSLRPERELGPGLRAYQSDSEFDYAAIYRDKNDVRLFLYYSPQFEGNLQEAILSKVSRHPARRIRQDLAGLRTGPGFRLGDTNSSVEHALGPPSERDHFDGYDIAFYLGYPRPVPSRPKAVRGNAKAFVYRSNKIVEIWIAAWSTEQNF